MRKNIRLNQQAHFANFSNLRHTFMANNITFIIPLMLALHTSQLSKTFYSVPVVCIPFSKANVMMDYPCSKPSLHNAINDSASESCQ